MASFGKPVRIAIPQPRVDDEATQRAIEAQRAASTTVLPFQKGVLIKDITITAGSTLGVDHGLARVPQGWFTCHHRTSAPVLYESGTPTNRTITLNHSGATATTFDLWIW